jgi:integrase
VETVRRFRKNCENSSLWSLLAAKRLKSAECGKKWNVHPTTKRLVEKPFEGECDSKSCAYCFRSMQDKETDTVTNPSSTKKRDMEVNHKYENCERQFQCPTFQNGMCFCACTSNAQGYVCHVTGSGLGLQSHSNASINMESNGIRVRRHFLRISNSTIRPEHCTSRVLENCGHSNQDATRGRNLRVLLSGRCTDLGTVNGTVKSLDSTSGTNISESRLYYLQGKECVESNSTNQTLGSCVRLCKWSDLSPRRQSHEDVNTSRNAIQEEKCQDKTGCQVDRIVDLCNSGCAMDKTSVTPESSRNAESCRTKFMVQSHDAVTASCKQSEKRGAVIAYRKWHSLRAEQRLYSDCHRQFKNRFWWRVSESSDSGKMANRNARTKYKYVRVGSSRKSIRLFYLRKEDQRIDVCSPVYRQQHMQELPGKRLRWCRAFKNLCTTHLEQMSSSKGIIAKGELCANVEKCGVRQHFKNERVRVQCTENRDSSTGLAFDKGRFSHDKQSIGAIHSRTLHLTGGTSKRHSKVLYKRRSVVRQLGFTRNSYCLEARRISRRLGALGRLSRGNEQFLCATAFNDYENDLARDKNKKPGYNNSASMGVGALVASAANHQDKNDGSLWSNSRQSKRGNISKQAVEQVGGSPVQRSDILRSTVEHARAAMITANVEKGSIARYKSEWYKFGAFCEMFGEIELPASSDIVELYLYHMAESGRGASIGRAKAAIRLAHIQAGWDNPCDSAGVKLASQLCAKHWKKRRKKLKRDPFPLIAVKVYASERPSDTSEFEHARNIALVANAFRGMMRGGEIAKTKGSSFEFDDSDGFSMIKWDLGKTKTDKEGADSIIPIDAGEQDSITCPVQAMHNYLNYYQQKFGKSPGANDLLFVHEDGSAMNTDDVSEIVRQMIRFSGRKETCSAHSLRSGGATYAAKCGLSLTEIMAIGRWKSDCAMRYIRALCGAASRLSLKMAL